jgi:hypothetical protein
MEVALNLADPIAELIERNRVVLSHAAAARQRALEAIAIAENAVRSAAQARATAELRLQTVASPFTLRGPS